MRLSGWSVAFLFLGLSLAFSAHSFPQTSEPSAFTTTTDEKPSRSAVSPRQLLNDLNQQGIAPQGLVVFDWSKTCTAAKTRVAGLAAIRLIC